MIYTFSLVGGAVISLSRSGTIWTGVQGFVNATLQRAANNWELTLFDASFGATNVYSNPVNGCPSIHSNDYTLISVEDSAPLLSGTISNSYSGISGTSGFTGMSGTSGFSGISAFSGQSGVSGRSGISGYSGLLGTSGFSGISGASAASGISGFSGLGISGFSGISSFSGTSGYSGVFGISGFSGLSAFSGFSALINFDRELTTNKRHGKFIVRMSKFGKTHRLGAFDQHEQANKIYREEKIKVYLQTKHGVKEADRIITSEGDVYRVVSKDKSSFNGLDLLYVDRDVR